MDRAFLRHRKVERRYFRFDIDAMFDKSIFSLDVATLASTRARSRRGIVFRDRPPSVSLFLILGSSCIFSKTRRRCPTFGTRGSHRVACPSFSTGFWSPVIFSRYFPPKPVKADYCASSKREQGISRSRSFRPIWPIKLSREKEDRYFLDAIKRVFNDYSNTKYLAKECQRDNNGARLISPSPSLSAKFCHYDISKMPLTEPTLFCVNQPQAYNVIHVGTMCL